jgi:histone deacetylase 6
MIMTGSTADYVGNMLVYLDEVTNPLTEVTARSIIVETYDGFNKVIADRSYYNLNPTRYTYTYPGPLITVNNDETVFVERGTMSAPVPITLDFPCALNLTLVPECEGFSFVPSSIDLSVGEVLEDFRISVPKDTNNNDFIINWTINGELKPLHYTPIAKSRFEVTKN